VAEAGAIVHGNKFTPDCIKRKRARQVVALLCCCAAQTQPSARCCNQTLTALTAAAVAQKPKNDNEYTGLA
jgi:hypothetical protein